MSSHYPCPNATYGPFANDWSGWDIHSVVDAIPPPFRDAILCLARQEDVDLKLALQAMLSSAFAGVQGLMLAKRPDRGTEPLSGYFLGIAETGSGKTVARDGSHRAHDAAEIARATSLRDANKSNGHLDAWSEEEARRPAILKDVNNRSLIEALQGVRKSGYLCLPEGWRALETSLFTTGLHTLDELWDNVASVSLIRSGDDSVLCYSPSLTMLLLTPESFFKAYLEKHGDRARKCGFMGRVLFTKLTPFKNSVSPIRFIDENALTNFDLCIRGFLREKSRAGWASPEPEVIQFSEEASAAFEAMKSELKALGSTRYSFIGEHADRGVQYLVRIAAVIHAVCQRNGLVQLDCLIAAYGLVRFFLEEAAQLFHPVETPTTKELAARQKFERSAEDYWRLLEILKNLCCGLQSTRVALTDVRVLFLEHASQARFSAALLKAKLTGVVVVEGTHRTATIGFAQNGALGNELGQIRLGHFANAGSL